MNATWQERTALICEAIGALRQMIAAEYRNAAGQRADEYLAEAKVLIETAFDILRREDRWAKKEPARLQATIH
jgi:hypothetical protein